MTAEERAAAERWRRGEPARECDVTIDVDGVEVRACTGETVASAMLAAGVDFERDREGAPRAPLCNMGTCFECVATVDGRAATRTCLIPVAQGMDVRTEERR